MAETTGIAWTDATQNFWEGCTKVGPGCDHCYAENRDKRWHGGGHWGVGAPRRRVVDRTFNRPLTWHRDRLTYEALAAQGAVLDGPAPPLWVFSCSLSDFFDKEVDPAWRADAWAVIKRASSLRWQILTKRPGLVRRMLPADWGEGRDYRHVGIIATVVHQNEVERDVPKLLRLKSHGVRWVGLSIEPQLDRIELRNIELDDVWTLDALGGRLWGHRLSPGVEHFALDWVICGGESRQGRADPRPFKLAWARRLAADCAATRVPFFMKQTGDHYVTEGGTSMVPVTRAGHDPAEWPADLRIRQLPCVYGGDYAR